MAYTPHTPDEVRFMLERIGAANVAELFDCVPASLRSRAGLKLAPPLAERALLDWFRERAAQNLSSRNATSFLGGGAYDHFVPAAVEALAGRGEFATAYTPYQAEISQGTLQAIYEFQTLICQLTGLDLANASLYDGASACAEAVLMAVRSTRRKRVVLSSALHPHYAEVVRTYLRGLDVQVETAPLSDAGTTRAPPLEDAAALVGCSCAELRSERDEEHWSACAIR